MPQILVEVPVDWCEATLNGYDLTINVEANIDISRDTEITIKGKTVIKTIKINQKGINTPPTGSIPDDVLIPVSSASASSFHSANPIELSFDGDYDTYFMTHWTQATFPVEVIYNFNNVEAMDYFIYYPRPGGANKNGLLGEFEVWYATEGNPAFTKLDNFDFKNSPTSVRINFASRLIKPTQVKFVLYRGYGSGTYAAIGEMEFYRRNPEAFDCLSVFTDYSCSELKDGITLSAIENISDPFFKYLATEIYNKDYDSEFRIQEYKAYQHPSIMAAINKTSTYSLLDNPTGIYVDANEELIVLANDPGISNVSLQIIDLANGYGSSSSYGISKGVNKIKTASKGLAYVMYHTNTGNEASIKLNIVTGKVNGYFDSKKHNKEDWGRLLEKATDTYFDVLGQYSHLTFPVADFKRYTPDGKALIDKYDELVYLEMEFMGLVKYGKMFKNKMYFHIDYGTTLMYATAYRTAYRASTMATMCNLSTLTASCWGPAHEVGHVNQTRPGMRWQGMTEVTNNIHSLHVQTTFGNTSRLVIDNVYVKAFTGSNSIINARTAFAESTDVFEQLIPFWQLKLYLMDALGRSEFYKDVYEHYRTTPVLSATQLTDGVYQLDFIRTTCKIANLDLTDFFEVWGFLRAVNIEINDYNTVKLTITQQQVDDLKAEIAAKNYPKPKHSNIHLITDLNVSDYKN
ncbi:M60 family metallopeptidase [Dysgonomonas reticulitermitis]